MAGLTGKALLLSMFVLCLAIAGCGRSQQGAPRSVQTADDTSGLCPAIQRTGLVAECAVNGSDSTIHVMIVNDDDEAARNVCAEVVNGIAQQTGHLTAQWMLQVYSPYRNDKPLAACPLH